MGASYWRAGRYGSGRRRRARTRQSRIDNQLQSVSRDPPFGGAHRAVTYLAWCVVHEKKALDRANARKLKRILNEKGVREYSCKAFPELNWWHVGHIPQTVRDGEISSEQAYQYRDEEL